MDSSDVGAPAPTPLRISTQNTRYPYGSSISSAASSSSSSVFSIDAPSSQSSVSSSTNSVHLTWDSENLGSYFPADYFVPHHAAAATSKDSVGITSRPVAPRTESSTASVPLEFRQHPRRTQPLAQQDARTGYTAAVGPRPPPPLVRQSDRKLTFVDGLVDTATQMVETIWPLSVLACTRDSVIGGKNVISLRTFVQEVLRRSRTSYSTLQVALYYLILIKPCIPKHDFTMEQCEDTQSSRAMQCGRRMFLAALILASKYLQDRNFSARAWSKISGLNTHEINTNEMAFLEAVNWKLHISEPVFQRWSDVVLRYTPSAHSPGSPGSSIGSSSEWKAVILSLTPDLDHFEFGSSAVPGAMSPPRHVDTTSPFGLAEVASPRSSGSNDQTPTNPCVIPRVLEPTPRASKSIPQAVPSLPKMGPLPTPTMTPQTSTFSTPAVSAGGLCPARSSMSIAMTQAQTASLARTTVDTWGCKSEIQGAFSAYTRRPSMTDSSSSVSSPESMISDTSTRSSRSSSISSLASSTYALPQPRLAMQATRRCAAMLSSTQNDSCRSAIPSSAGSISWGAFVSSPESYTGPSSDCPTPHSLPPSSHPTLTHNNSAHEAALGLQELALNRQRVLPRPTLPSKGRKRPSSVDLSLQQNVRDLIAPQTLADLTTTTTPSHNGHEGTVLPDPKLADSFAVNGLARHACRSKLATHSKDASRKRPCRGEEAVRLDRLRKEALRMPGPGMWDGIL
ncbi:MAG: hypothetical protein LQ347_006698 [Umbilicaria vellea]|nr:MAG: hypothetical protein LQ347_006698 [Umbilicaria vellea]